MGGVGLYIHLPFCKARCTYCDFNSYSGLEWLFDDYTQALVRESESAAAGSVRTIYLGGGTPSMVPTSHLARILKAARSASVLGAEVEITAEANPGTVSAERLAQLRTIGVNRLSIGVQSFDDGQLELLGRVHTAKEAAATVRCARAAGFENLSLDLIYGLPGQSLTSWHDSLKQALRLAPEHLSLYALTVEADTALAAEIARGNLPSPDPDLAADMVELAWEELAADGYTHYEISNWARQPALACRHNLIYWRNEPYLGLGAGAHSWANGRRWVNVASPTEYTARMLRGHNPIQHMEVVDQDQEMTETMIMGLRLLQEGIEFERWRMRFGTEVRQQFGKAVTKLQKLSLLEVDSQRLRLTRRGWLVGNQVFMHFLPDDPL